MTKSNKFEIVKKSEDKQMVFGWASVAKDAQGNVLVDHQGDIIEIDVLEPAAYEYVLNSRLTGERHDPAMRAKGRLVESMVFTKEKQEALGIPAGVVPEGWFVGFYIEDQETWNRVKKGNYLMFSIEGSAQRIPA